MPLDALTSAEISLPAPRDATQVGGRIAVLPRHVDLVGLTDNHAGKPRMSPLAAVALAREQGVATVVHVSCRDRNRLALRSEVVGAAALGSEGILCLYGDPVPDVPRVRDYTTTRLLADARGWAASLDLAAESGKLGDCRIHASVPVIRTARMVDILNRALPSAIPEPAARQIGAGGGIDLA